MEAISTGAQTGSHTLRVTTEGVDKSGFQQQRRVIPFLLANANRLAIVTLRTVGVEPPVYIMTSAAAYARCICFLPPLLLTMYTKGDSFGFCKLHSDFCCLFGVKILLIAHHWIP